MIALLAVPFVLALAAAFWALVLAVILVLGLTILGLKAAHNYDQAARATTLLRAFIGAFHPARWGSRRR